MSCTECATASQASAVKLGGRPFVDFGEASERTKTRRSVEAAEDANMNIEKLCIALREQLKLAGRPQDAQVLKDIQKSDKDGSSTGPPPTTYTDDEALALLLDCRLSRADYMTLRTGACEKGAKLYPSYHNVLSAKKKCVPLKGDGEPAIHVSDYSAGVDLDALLMHTAKRIMESIQVDEEDLPPELELLSKVGFDGAMVTHFSF